MLSLILCILIGHFLLDTMGDILNLRHIKPLPEAFKDVYDNEKYAKSQAYLKDQTVFSLIKDTFNLAVLIGFILMGGFNSVDVWVRGFGFGSIGSGLIFFGVLGGGLMLLGLPFSYYATFNLEGRYGFNTTTIKTFILDTIKSLVLSVIIGGILLSGVVWFFESFTQWGWLYCWLFVAGFQLVLMFLAPQFIMPLFNKFEPLHDEELAHKIQAYATSQSVPISGIFQMDGSKRSKKANAFFTGFGRFRRIVLYDTLIKNHSHDELVTVLAHEIGHFKRHHIVKLLVMSLVTSFVMFYLLNFAMMNPVLFQAFSMDTVSVYASLVFFGFLYSPVSALINIGVLALSRRHEFEADAFAVKTTGNPNAFVLALKKLSSDNLSNLTPHPFKVFMEYSHPTVLARIKAIQD